VAESFNLEFDITPETPQPQAPSIGFAAAPDSSVSVAVEAPRLKDISLNLAPGDERRFTSTTPAGTADVETSSISTPAATQPTIDIARVQAIDTAFSNIETPVTQSPATAPQTDTAINTGIPKLEIASTPEPTTFERIQNLYQADEATTAAPRPEVAESFNLEFDITPETPQPQAPSIDFVPAQPDALAYATPERLQPRDISSSAEQRVPKFTTRAADAVRVETAEPATPRPKDIAQDFDFNLELNITPETPQPQAPSIGFTPAQAESVASAPIDVPVLNTGIPKLEIASTPEPTTFERIQNLYQADEATTAAPRPEVAESFNLEFDIADTPAPSIDFATAPAESVAIVPIEGLELKDISGSVEQGTPELVDAKATGPKYDQYGIMEVRPEPWQEQQRIEQERTMLKTREALRKEMEAKEAIQTPGLRRDGYYTLMAVPTESLGKGTPEVPTTEVVDPGNGWKLEQAERENRWRAVKRVRSAVRDSLGYSDQTAQAAALDFLDFGLIDYLDESDSTKVHKLNETVHREVDYELSAWNLDRNYAARADSDDCSLEGNCVAQSSLEWAFAEGLELDSAGTAHLTTPTAHVVNTYELEGGRRVVADPTLGSVFPVHEITLDKKDRYSHLMQPYYLRTGDRLRVPDRFESGHDGLLHSMHLWVKSENTKMKTNNSQGPTASANNPQGPTVSANNSQGSTAPANNEMSRLSIVSNALDIFSQAAGQ
ncbi:hypothetical protein ACFL1E_02250, partial [Candidatus Omnitrophota bacterium]